MSALVHDPTAWAGPRFANVGVFGVGRRPLKRDRDQSVDVAAIAVWQAAQDRAHEEYLARPSHLAAELGEG